MPLEAIENITRVEADNRERKASAEAKAKQIVADVQREGLALLQQTRTSAAERSRELLQQAETRAAARGEEIRREQRRMAELSVEMIQRLAREEEAVAQAHRRLDRFVN